VRLQKPYILCPWQIGEPSPSGEGLTVLLTDGGHLTVRRVQKVEPLPPLWQPRLQDTALNGINRAQQTICDVCSRAQYPSFMRLILLAGSDCNTAPPSFRGEPSRAFPKRIGKSVH